MKKYKMNPIVSTMDGAIKKLETLIEKCSHPFSARRFVDGGKVNFCIACGHDLNK